MRDGRRMEAENLWRESLDRRAEWSRGTGAWARECYSSRAIQIAKHISHLYSFRVLTSHADRLIERARARTGPTGTVRLYRPPLWPLSSTQLLIRRKAPHSKLSCRTMRRVSSFRSTPEARRHSSDGRRAMRSRLIVRRSRRLDQTVGRRREEPRRCATHDKQRVNGSIRQSPHQPAEAR